MPTLVRLLTLLAVICGLGWGGMWWLANSVQPAERDMVLRVPSERFAK